jgi:hypothetical protein
MRPPIIPAGTAITATSETTPVKSRPADFPKLRNLLSPNQIAIAIPAIMQSA